MPEALLLTHSSRSLLEISSFIEQKEYRVKAITDLTVALEWLRMRDFECMIVENGLPIEDQQKLADLLWKSNPLAPFVVFSLEGDKTEAEREVKLFGAEVAFGDDRWVILENALKQGAIKRRKTNDDFQILVVEDLDAPRDIVCAFIEGMGYSKVKGVASAAEALEELTKGNGGYSCIVTDMKMPQMNGEELIRRVRASSTSKHIPIIVLTAYGSVDHLVQCLRAGASGFLLKPPKKADITRELNRALRIVSHGQDPRLSSPEDAELLRDILIDRGYA